MTEKESTSGVWRKRAVATVGVAAAVAAGSVALASSAQAVTPTPARTSPTITVTAPASLANDGTGSGAFSIEVNNSAKGNEAIPGTAAGDNTVANTATISVNFTVPAGVQCTQVTLTPDTGTTTPAAAQDQIPAFTVLAAGTTANTCTATVAGYTQPANSDYTYGYDLAVNSVGATLPTGTLTSSASIAITDGLSGNVNTITSNTASTSLLAPAAPVLSTTVPPSAIIYQDYSATVVTSPGTPSATADDYAVFEAPTTKGTDGTYPDTSQTNTFETDGGTLANGDKVIYLDNDQNDRSGLYLDTTTGKIAGNPDETSATPYYSYTIIANNGEGGATAAQVAPANPGGNTAKPSAAVALHDVQSAPFTITILFSDVSNPSTFSTEIYGLSDNGAIHGFADGTFRPGQKVTRAEFVSILFNDDPEDQFPGQSGNDSGECTTIEPSAFSDVPNASPFCEAIKSLSQAGILRGANGAFRPSDTITRQEIAAVIYRFYAYERTGVLVQGDASFTSPSPFSDVTSSNPLAGDIEFAASKGIVKGYTNGTFKPSNATTRDASAAVVYRDDLLFEND